MGGSGRGGREEEFGGDGAGLRDRTATNLRSESETARGEREKRERESRRLRRELDVSA